MGVRLDRLIRSAQSDSKITDTEVDSLIAEVKANGVVSKTEKASLNKVLQVSASQFEPAAKAKLEAFLSGGTPPPPPPPASDPYTVMTQKLTTAAEGGLSGNELAGAERDIASKYGSQVAKDVLLRALGARTGDLTVDGVTWLQQKHGAMGGQVDRFQTVLQTHLKDAKLLDANFDGKLDENDKVFTVGADGKVNVQTLGAALRDRVKIGAAMVGACEDMDKAKHQFALIKDQSFNAAFWAPAGNGGFTLKPGVRPSDAVNDIFKNPSLYKFECATALVIVHYKAMVDLLGPKDFDTVCANLKMGPWVYESTMQTNWKISGGETDASPERQAQLRAGDYTYFKNWDVSETGRAAGWQGENVISLGGGKYYGHPFGVSTQEHIVTYLNQHRNAGSTRSAGMLDLQASLDSKLLQLDKTPGE
jgi:protein-glutamine gamma-glutamyltransferase